MIRTPRTPRTPRPPRPPSAPSALVLAAGNSTRIASVNGGRPKPLLDVGGRPVIVRTLEWLAAYGVRDVWMNLHHRPDDIRTALGDVKRLGLQLHYSVEPEILGTAGAFRALATEFPETALVVYGDNLMRFDLSALLAAHGARRATVTMALFDPRVSANTGIAGGRVECDSSGRVTRFVEGSTSSAGYVNAGAYVVEPSIAQSIGPGFQDFARDVFPRLIASESFYGHVIEAEGYCLGLDTPESYRIATDMIASRQVALA